MTVLTVREYAIITTVDGPTSLDRGTVSQSDFDWLANLSGLDEQRSKIARMIGPRTLKVQNYVGVIRAPSGLDIEILPKCTSDAESLSTLRRRLLRMIAASHSLPPFAADAADIEVLDRPLTEWTALAFVRLVAALIKRGVRSDYVNVETNERFLRGRLDLARQLRANPTDYLNFHISHDIFSVDRPENRLIRSAVDRVVKRTNVSTTFRLGRELAILLNEISPSRSIRLDLSRWRDDRLMAHYRPLRGLCELILTGQTPFATPGSREAESMLFPMERLYEEFVERAIRARLPRGHKLKRAPRTHTLCQYNNDGWFNLRPDYVVTGGDRTWVLDAKWKLLNRDRAQQFGLSQGDLYQLNAYGQTYLDGDGDMFLIYPLSAEFPQIDKALLLRPNLRLHVLGVDLETGNLDIQGLS